MRLSDLPDDCVNLILQYAADIKVNDNMEDLRVFSKHLNSNMVQDVAAVRGIRGPNQTLMLQFMECMNAPFSIKTSGRVTMIRENVPSNDKGLMDSPCNEYNRPVIYWGMSHFKTYSLKLSRALFATVICKVSIVPTCWTTEHVLFKELVVILIMHMVSGKRLCNHHCESTSAQPYVLEWENQRGQLLQTQRCQILP